MGTPDKCFSKHNDFVTRCISGETIIVPIKSGVGDLDSIYTVNEVGTTVWQLIDGRRTVSQIIESISDEYEVAAEDAANDVLDFLGMLEGEGLIRASAENKG